MEGIPVSYIYYNLKPVEGVPLTISVNGNHNVKLEAIKDSYIKARELKSEEEEIASILENEIRMKYELKIRMLKQSTKVSQEIISKLIKKCNQEIEELRNRVEAIRAAKPELVAILHLIPARLEVDEKRKREVELAGMKAVMEYEIKNGRIPKDVSQLNLGYDIESYDPRTGETRYIEVKSFKTTGVPELTEHEYEVARTLASKYWLYIVKNALTNPRIRIVRDPAHTAMIIKVSRESYRIVKVIENRYIVKLRG